MGFFSDFFGGGDEAPSAPVIASPPPPKDIRDFYNYLAGVKYVKGKDANGNEIDQVIRLPRSKEDQAFFSEMEEGVRENIRNIKTIAQKNPAQLPQYMRFINGLAQLDQETVRDLNAVAGLEGIENDVRYFRDISTQYLNERFDVQSRALEDSLAQRGLSRSSQGDRERRELTRRIDKAMIDNDWNALQYSENLASQKFGNRMTGFNARQIGRQAQAGTLQTEYGAERQYYADSEAERAARIREQADIANTQNSLITQDYQKAMGGNVEQHALNRYSADNQIQMQHYSADANRKNMNYQNQMAQYNANAQRPTLGGTLLSLGGTIGGAMLTAPSGGIMGTSLAGTLGNKIGSWLS